ncbi:hypothetical protein EV10_0070 [Prochlorococcus marinus str. SS51]|nr:hypothetical protein EV08_1905 [Prochlorococcus marinus str. SS2]KGG22930.1 hypothetical protein EV09_1672 [Prochlorococcus marinus str. SS35]KGG34034.1 hypothetical protein EV10_0070 [Prochlorococcus marinus str. SS51]
MKAGNATPWRRLQSSGHKKIERVISADFLETQPLQIQIWVK